MHLHLAINTYWIPPYQPFSVLLHSLLGKALDKFLYNLHTNLQRLTYSYLRVANVIPASECIKSRFDSFAVHSIIGESLTFVISSSSWTNIFKVSMIRSVREKACHSSRTLTMANCQYWRRETLMESLTMNPKTDQQLLSPLCSHSA